MRSDQNPSSTPDDLVVVPRAQLDALVARVEALERRDGPDSGPEPGGSAPAGVAGAVGRRRALLGLAGAAAGAAATMAGPSRPAAADNGDELIVGTNTNTSTSATGLAVTGTSAGYGFGVVDNGLSTLDLVPALLAHAGHENFFVAVLGLGNGGSDALVGRATGSGAGLRASSTNGAGAVISNGAAVPALGALNVGASAPPTGPGQVGGTAIQADGHTHLYLTPNLQPAPPASSAAALEGHLRWVHVEGTTNALWACIEPGTPGTWRKITGMGTAGAFHLLPTPKRVYDSRPGTQPSQGPKTPLPGGNAARTIDLKHNSSGVPAGATGVLLTILLVNAANANGNLTVWANDKSKPASNTMVWGGSSGRFTATAVSALDAQARVKVDASHSTNVVLDVVGYYR
ncbi:MAG TPA: hypothetical protein VGO60_02945 [Iamia sp.]|nr:hypothetical protein [Iamia sp.]